MEYTLSDTVITIRDLLIHIKLLLETYLLDLKQIQTIYIEAEKEKDPVELFYQLSDCETVYEVIPELKNIDVYHILYDIKTTLTKLFYDSGFRKDIFEYDIERQELIESFDEIINPVELLTILFAMARHSDEIMMFDLLDGKFIQAYEQILNKLKNSRYFMDYPIMNEYQRALNRLFNIASDEGIAKECYSVLNRLIFKERPLRALLIGFYADDHRILCPSCETELNVQNQRYCMCCGQKLNLS